MLSEQMKKSHSRVRYKNNDEKEKEATQPLTHALAVAFSNPKIIRKKKK